VSVVAARRDHAEELRGREPGEEPRCRTRRSERDVAELPGVADLVPPVRARMSHADPPGVATLTISDSDLRFDRQSARAFEKPLTLAKVGELASGPPSGRGSSAGPWGRPPVRTTAYRRASSGRPGPGSRTAQRQRGSPFSRPVATASPAASIATTRPPARSTSAIPQPRRFPLASTRPSRRAVPHQASSLKRQQHVVGRERDEAGERPRSRARGASHPQNGTLPPRRRQAVCRPPRPKKRPAGGSRTRKTVDAFPVQR